MRASMRQRKSRTPSSQYELPFSSGSRAKQRWQRLRLQLICRANKSATKILERRRRHLGAKYCYHNKIIGRYRPAKSRDGDMSSQLVDAQCIYWLVIAWSSSINESGRNVLTPTWTEKCIRLPTSAATSSLSAAVEWLTLEESKSCMTVISYKPQALHARWTEFPSLISTRVTSGWY